MPLGYKHTEKTKQKMKGRIPWNKGIPCSEETRQKISEGKKGKKNPFHGKSHSEKARQKMSDARKGRKFSDEHKRKIGDANKGRKWSEESKQKISDAHQGKVISEKHKLRISETQKGRKTSEETKQKMGNAAKAGYMAGRKVPRMIGKGNGGIREDLGQYFRSNWEANTARILHYEGINYQYESERFDLGETGTYLPDFYIPDADFYIEVKGYATPESQMKLMVFKQDHDLLIIRREEYSILRENYNSLINWEGY